MHAVTGPLPLLLEARYRSMGCPGSGVTDVHLLFLLICVLHLLLYYCGVSPLHGNAT